MIEKFLSDGTFDKVKASLIAGGYRHDHTVYEDASFATVATQSVMMIIAIATAEGQRVAACNVG